MTIQTIQDCKNLLTFDDYPLDMMKMSIQSSHLLLPQRGLVKPTSHQF